jgi:hypothetical protein
VRTAVVITGQVKRLKEDAQSVITNLIEPYKADVFLSVWGNNTLSMDEVISIYQPKAMEIEEPFIMPNVPRKTRNYDCSMNIQNPPHNVWAMFYRIERGNELRKRYEKAIGREYHTIIRFRFEIGVHQSCPILTPEANTVYIPEGQDHMGGVCDTMAIGDSTSMDHYASIYSNLNDYHERNMPTHPESVVRKHLELNGITIKRFRLHTTLRGNPWNPAY